MTNRNTRRGFTLIELLVVVLIIGILAAIAVPQYQKAIEKARLAEALATGAVLEKSLQTYLLTNGFPADQTVLLGKNLLDVEPTWLHCSDDGYCQTKHFNHLVRCYDGQIVGTFCAIDIWRQEVPDESEDIYSLTLSYNSAGNLWKRFYINEQYAYTKNIAAFLESSGWEKD